MIRIDQDGKRLCDIQAELFEKSIRASDMSSEVFVRRFMNSKIATELDSGAFLDDSKTIGDIFMALDEQYGTSDYGSTKIANEILYWVGYLYRYFSFTYEISSKQAYKLLPFKYVASTFLSYHSLDVAQAIERLLEAKNISFKEEDIIRKGIDLLRVIRNHKDPYASFPIFGNERFHLRKIMPEDTDDLLKVYSDMKSLQYFNHDNCNGDDFRYSTKERMNEAMAFWENAYQNKRFIIWAIVDKNSSTVIGTIEQFHRDSMDDFNNCSLLRLDLRSDYEQKDMITNILKLIIPSSFELFSCDRIITKSFDGNIERENALYELGFRESMSPFIGNDNRSYFGYWELKQSNK